MIGGQILIVFFGGAAFETEPIPAQFWLISIVIGAGSLVVGLIARLLPDKPLEAVLRALRVYDDKTQNLPQDSPRAEAHRTKESKSELEKAASTCQPASPPQWHADLTDCLFHSVIERVRGGRHKASTELYTWLRQDAPSERSRSVIKGLCESASLLLTSIVAQMSRVSCTASSCSRRNQQRQRTIEKNPALNMCW